MSRFRLLCAGCGTPAPSMDDDPFPFRCRRAASAADADHVVTKVLSDDLPRWPAGSSESNPFLRYQDLLYSSTVPRATGEADDATSGFAQAVRALDDAIFEVCGHRFCLTPFERANALGAALSFTDRGGVWIKDETHNVSGSHKGRHLAGIMLYLMRVRGTASVSRFSREKAGNGNGLPLAIASCGNAALAAAVVARAAGWPLRTFVPPDANPGIVDRLQRLGADVVTCPRQPSERGDPCYHRFQEALSGGALPFCCQGPDNGLTIEGGETIAYEMTDQFIGAGLDAVVIQVGGGALASACVQGFERAIALGRLPRMPRVYTVQTQGAAPLLRAFERVAARARQHGIADALSYAATHRSQFMWPWEREPRSIAHGILDDETYDWLAVVRGMLETNGKAIVVDEERLEEANRLGRRTTGVNVDHTGSAGLAGLMEFRESGDIRADENVAVIFSGVKR